MKLRKARADGAPEVATATTDAEALEKLAEGGYPLAKVLKDFRDIGTLKKTFITGLLERIDTQEGLHTSYQQASALTGRLSSRDPNLQNGYALDTEVLTPLGWRYLPDLDKGDRVASWKNGFVEFVEPAYVLAVRFVGEMIEFKSDWLDLLVAPGQKIISLTREGTFRRETATTWLKKWPTTTIIDRKMIRAGYRSKGQVLSSRERILMWQAIAVQAEGYVRKDCRAVEIRVQSSRKQEQLRVLFAGHRISERGGRARVWLHLDDPCLQWLDLPSKNFRIPKLTALSADELRHFVREIHRWDGDSTRQSTYLQRNDRRGALDAVQIAAILAGQSTRWYERSSRHSVVDFHRDPSRFASRMTIRSVPYDGYVCSLKVDSGCVVVRRSNQVVVCGTAAPLLSEGVRSVIRARLKLLAS